MQEINDLPPNPNQQPSNPSLAPRPKVLRSFFFSKIIFTLVQMRIEMSPVNTKMYILLYFHQVT